MVQINTNLLICLSKGVFSFFMLFNDCPIKPNSVFFPTDVTSIIPKPFTASVPE